MYQFDQILFVTRESSLQGWLSFNLIPTPVVFCNIVYSSGCLVRLNTHFTDFFQVSLNLSQFSKG